MHYFIFIHKFIILFTQNLALDCIVFFALKLILLFPFKVFSFFFACDLGKNPNNAKIPKKKQNIRDERRDKTKFF